MASDETIRRLCERLYADVLSANREERRKWRAQGWDDNVSPAEEAFEAAGVGDDLAGEEAERMVRGDRRSVAEDARRLAQEAGLPLEGDEFDALLFELQRTLVRAYRDCTREWEADLSGRQRLSESGGTLSPTAPGPFATGSTWAGAGGGKSLAEAVAEYLADGKERKRWAAKTSDETARVLGWFVEWVGGDRAVGHVTREDCRGFEDALSKIPAKLPRNARLRQEIARPGKSRATLSPTGQAKYRGRVASFLHFAEGEGWIEKSPMPKAQRQRGAGRSGGNKGEPFTDGELARIFAADYQREAGAQGGGVPVAAKFWLPLIALYTGARLGEVAQLHVGDVREVEGGVWAFHFTDEGEGQRVKTESSRRAVPMHSQLAELGLRDFAERRAKRGGGLLFREVKRNKNGWGTKEGTWFRRRLRELGINAPRRKVFHSFRHTVSNRLKSQGVAEYLIAAILGHTNESMSTGRYGGEIEARKLVPVVERLDFRGPLKALFEALNKSR